MKKEGNLQFSVIWRGTKLLVEMNPSATLKDLGTELQKQTNVKADTIRLIVATHKNSKILYPFAEELSYLTLEGASILQGKSIRMMGVPPDEVDEVIRNEKVDLRIAGFDEEENRMRKRMLRGQKVPQLPQGIYIFCDFQTLHIPGMEFNPPASEALKLMHRLAADPGIVAIMNKHRWRVGIMTELAPVGYVGVSPKCILGLNKNHGEEISLRLRTDDLKGFRKYESIKKTLLHELAHMVHSEHDANFYALDKQLNEEAAALDWTKSRSRTLNGGQNSESYDEGMDVDNNGSFSRKLGGQTPVFPNARASSAAAAYHRLASTSVQPSGAPLKASEPDDNRNDERDYRAANDVYVENLENNKQHLDKYGDEFEPDPDTHLSCAAMKPEVKAESGVSEITLEPDPNNCCSCDSVEPEQQMESLDNQYCNKNADLFEPDPDDCLSYVAMKPDREAESGESGITSEPDPDDCFESLKPDRHMKSGEFGFTSEPDPDDCEMEIPCSGNKENLIPPNTTNVEPNPNDIRAEQNLMNDDGLVGPVSIKPDLHGPQGIMIQPEAEHGISMQTRDVSATWHTDGPVIDEEELQRIQDPVSLLCSRLQKAIEMLRSEVNPTGATGVLQTLSKIVRNVIEHPEEVKFKRLRKANPVIQRNILNYTAATEIMSLIGFTEDVTFDEFGKSETYLVLKHQDPGRLWLARSSLETRIAHLGSA